MAMRKSIISIICAVCGLVLVFCFAAMSHASQKSQDELRAKYPLISEADYLLDTPNFSFEERIEYAPHIAEIEVVKQLPDYTVVVSDEAYGFSEEVEFCQYQVRLVSNISDTDISTDDDNTFVITFAKIFSQSYPALADQMDAICSIEAASGAHEGKYILYDKSFYYVDTQYALAAYAEDDSPARKMCNKDALVEQIKTIKRK